MGRHSEPAVSASSLPLDPERPLADLRERYMYSQDEASKLLEVSRSLWCAWETGRRNISLHDAQRIRQVFHLPDDAFLQILDHYGQGTRPNPVKPIPAWRQQAPAEGASGHA